MVDGNHSADQTGAEDEGATPIYLAVALRCLAHLDNVTTNNKISRKRTRIENDVIGAQRPLGPGTQPFRSTTSRSSYDRNATVSREVNARPEDTIVIEDDNSGIIGGVLRGAPCPAPPPVLGLNARRRTSIAGSETAQSGTRRASRPPIRPGRSSSIQGGGGRGTVGGHRGTVGGHRGTVGGHRGGRGSTGGRGGVSFGGRGGDSFGDGQGPSFAGPSNPMESLAMLSRTLETTQSGFGSLCGSISTLLNQNYLQAPPAAAPPAQSSRRPGSSGSDTSVNTQFRRVRVAYKHVQDAEETGNETLVALAHQALATQRSKLKGMMGGNPAINDENEASNGSG